MAALPFTRSQRYLALAQAFRLPEAGAPSDLTTAYSRLFLGPGGAIAPPYESVYVEGRLAGEPAGQVARCYAEAGLQVTAARRELPDHVSLELAFMGHLAAQEERDPGRAAPWRERQGRFLHDHLARWLPQFCHRVVESGVDPFYCRAAQEAKELVEEDVARLRMAGAGSPAVARPEARNPNAGPGRRYPNLYLAVALSRCSLCTLCADACRPGALAVDCTPTTLRLTFDPARCNGCRACLRLCPEGAIAIERGPALAAPPSRPRAAIAASPRVVCPGCRRPHIAAPWLERLAERLGGGSSVRRSLALCPACKANSGDDWPEAVAPSRESLTSVH